MAGDELSTRAAIVAACRSFEARRLNQGTSGNVSVRWRNGFLLTPSALPYERMEPEDVVWLDLDGKAEGRRRPSSEWRFHRAIMAERADVGAVVHVHSPHATALACLGEDLPAFHYMVAVAGGDDIRCAPYATFGTEELAGHVVDALAGRRACLLANHGQIAVGTDLDDAVALAVEVEALCEQYLLARAVGPPRLLDRAAMAMVLERFDRYRKGTLE